jgi:telomerase reverse transcriptase
MLPESSQSTEGSTKFKTQISAGSLFSADLTLAAMPAQKPSMMDYATPTALVSAFCRTVMNRLIPLGFWGSGVVAKQNRKIMNQNVESFVQLQRFAKFSLHHVSQGLKVIILSGCH